MDKYIFRFFAIVICVFFVMNSIYAKQILTKGKDIKIGNVYSLRSEVLGEDREIFVWLPVSYANSKKSYPVFYLLDGEIQFHSTSGTIEFLSKFQHIPEMILIAVKNVDRERDFLPFQIDNWPPVPGAVKFRKFLSRELIPLIDKEFRTTSYRILSGHSFGAVFSIDSFLNEPDIFTSYIAISPALNWDKTNIKEVWTEVLKKTIYNNKFLYLSISADDKGAIEPTKELASIIKEVSPQGLNWKYEFRQDEDHLTVVHPVVFNALRWFHEGWRISEAGLETMTLEDVVGHYKTLSGRYGSEVQVPEGTLFNLGYILLDQKKKGEAIETFQLGIKLYPEEAACYLGLGELYMENGSNDLAEKYFRIAVNIAEQKKDQMILPVVRGLLKKILDKKN